MTPANLSQVTPPRTVAAADLAQYLSDLRYAGRFLLKAADRSDRAFEPTPADQHREVVARLHALHELIQAGMDEGKGST